MFALFVQDKVVSCSFCVAGARFGVVREGTLAAGAVLPYTFFGQKKIMIGLRFLRTETAARRRPEVQNGWQRLRRESFILRGICRIVRFPREYSRMSFCTAG